ncbi:AI-2E family transporter [Flavobacterium sp. MK4S-17]|uniref:AI-2E family transporter n=1 Tax=Flavobacterium sp. MK4S-17 TaxID=2543737 RepID=UPI00135BF89D|nr:AI-2E family transporter [Flavobacterium sp. MK4S-17]
MTKGKRIIFTGAAIIAGLYFLFLGLVKAKPFLAPLVTALVLAMLMLPVSRRLEKWGIKRVYASLLNTFFLFLVSVGFVALISLQVQGFLSDWDKARQKIMPHIEQIEQAVYKNTPIEKEDLKLGNSASPGAIGKQAITFINKFYSFAGDYLLTFIYTFFLLNYRSKFRKFILKLFPAEKQAEADKVLKDTAGITQGYLYGKFLLMLFLAVLYAVGMGLTGVSNFIVISLLAALLSIIPYIGNIIGFIIALGLGYVTDGDTTALIGIVATFFVVQFIESYFFEPYVVGDNVDLDPLMTILAVVAGSLLWGVIGMILSVPVLGMINIVFKHVGPLKPFAYLFSNVNEKD